MFDASKGDIYINLEAFSEKISKFSLIFQIKSQKNYNRVSFYAINQSALQIDNTKE